MGRLVFGGGVPHTPVFPRLVLEDPTSEVAELYSRVAEVAHAARPDALIVVAADHVNTFFFDHWPVFAIATADEIEGPNDEPGMQQRVLPSSSEIGSHVHRHCLDAGFDVSSCGGRVGVDHGVTVPLFFLSLPADMPVVPFFLGSIVPPFPSASRCFALGEAVAEAIAALPGDVRVGVVASGSFSLEVAGPRSLPGELWGVPDRPWAERVMTLIQERAYPALVAEATAERMLGAGNVGGELLSWIVVLGAVKQLRLVTAALQDGQGHGFAAWAAE